MESKRLTRGIKNCRGRGSCSSGMGNGDKAMSRSQACYLGPAFNHGVSYMAITNDSDSANHYRWFYRLGDFKRC